ncbi:MAG: hypothetical protein P8J32_01465, partial [bacterium]|nr:hypothetical protein [bacterium]
LDSPFKLISTMKKKIYYTTDIEFHDDDLELGPTGNKTVNVYHVENGEVKHWVSLECELSDSSEDQIQEYLDDNGYGDQEYEFTIL